MKKIVSLLLSLSFLIFLVFSFSSCAKSIKPQNRIFYDYFDTPIVIYDYSGLDRREFNQTVNELEESIAEYHRLFDIYNEYEGITNLCTVNRLAGQGAVKVDAPIVELLLFAVDMYDLTDGNVNVCMGSVLSLWHTLRKEGKRIPTDAELSEAGKHISIDSLIVDAENSTVEITDPEASLDVGAVAKGYVCQRVCDMLSARGMSGWALDFGGNLRFVGKKPNGDGWVTGIKAPDGVSIVERMTLFDTSLVTSGVYERYYTVDGVNYHHIINKNTLKPENKYFSVSVSIPDSGIADALSTAFFNMEISECEVILHKLDGAFAVFIMNDGQIVRIGE